MRPIFPVEFQLLNAIPATEDSSDSTCGWVWQIRIRYVVSKVTDEILQDGHRRI